MRHPSPRRQGQRGTGPGEGAASPSFVAALRGLSRRGSYTELLDQPGNDPRTLAGNLRDLRLLNRWLGWSAGVWAELRPLLRGQAGPLTLLDVATGSADVPRALARRAAREGVTLRLIGTDISAAVLADARRVSRHEVALIRHDATALPFADGSVDVALLCLAAHHLDPYQLAAALRELARVSRRAVIVSDLERGRLAYTGARLMALVLRNRLTAHDGPISVLRAYTVSELRALARAAGLRRGRVRRRFPFRMTLVAVRG
jgi:SAM-dependent methyltransferase